MYITEQVYDTSPSDGYANNNDAFSVGNGPASTTEAMIKGLRARGHAVDPIVASFDRELFGRAQVCTEIRNIFMMKVTAFAMMIFGIVYS